MGKHWSLDDIPWERFDAAAVDAEVVKAIKAVALVEHDSADYVTYLCNVFEGEPEFQAAVRRWGAEEEQHGKALARWARLADPGFDLEHCLARFRAGYRLPLEVRASVRGSRSAELLARCVVGAGTSALYSALRDATDEPVLKAISQRIAGDEFRHYKLFYEHLKRYRVAEPLGLWRRLRVAFGRVAETTDDELAFAYHCATGERAAYDRKRCSRAYERRVAGLYRFGHIARALAMILKAVGLKPQGRLHKLLARAAWRWLGLRKRRLERLAA